MKWHLYHSPHLLRSCQYNLLILISLTAYLNTLMSGYGMGKVSGFIQLGLSMVKYQVIDGMGYFGRFMGLIQD